MMGNKWKFHRTRSSEKTKPLTSWQAADRKGPSSVLVEKVRRERWEGTRLEAWESLFWEEKA